MAITDCRCPQSGCELCGLPDDTGERLRQLQAEIERLQEKCFNDTMAAKKSGYEEGRAEVERLEGVVRLAGRKLAACKEYAGTDDQGHQIVNTLLREVAEAANTKGVNDDC